MTNAEARFNKSLRPRKPEGSLGRTAQDVHLDSHTAPELCRNVACPFLRIGNVNVCDSVAGCVCVFFFFFFFFLGGGGGKGCYCCFFCCCCGKVVLPTGTASKAMTIGETEHG